VRKDLGVLNSGWFFDPDYEWGIGSSPIVYKNLVIVQCDIQRGSFIAAFDAASGKEVWRTQRDEIPSWSTPTIFESNGKAELVTQATTFTRGYDPDTGKELWKFSATPRSRSRRRSSAPGSSSSPTVPRRPADLRAQARRGRRHHAQG
jgi:outer membrane protein assembly factor BamB